MNGRRHRRGSVDPQRVFVVHGRDASNLVALLDLLKSFGLSPIEWTEAVQLTGSGAPFIGDVLTQAFDCACAIVVLLTGDDQARLRPDLVQPDDSEVEKQLAPQCRPNVLFEAGMAFASHPSRTILVQIGHVRPFSDLDGRHVIHMDGSVDQRKELATRLLTAGCKVNLTGEGWKTAGAFQKPNSTTVTPAITPVSNSHLQAESAPMRLIAVSDLVGKILEHLDVAWPRHLTLGDIVERMASVAASERDAVRAHLVTLLRAGLIEEVEYAGGLSEFRVTPRGRDSLLLNGRLRPDAPGASP